MGTNTTFSTYLFADLSFLEGMARVMDIGGTLQAYNESPTPAAADAIAIASDWLMVGKDLQSAIEEYAHHGAP